ncbi:chaperonin 10-like protein [Aspergillus ambiguus]|uniref:zinc-dependent alcohol dehydrogenase family protein n=1 Tax=Aspergillus ambiguus TaxID=176160 RepID=UPI003CCCD3E2
MAETTMKALVYAGTNTLTIQERPKPSIIAPTDAVVRMLYASICGSDLHIIKGDVPSISPGRVLGHEGVGIVDSLGSAVQGFSKGDRVLVACMTSCGSCRFCRRGISAHCQTGGWTLGNKTDGTQAEYVRVPHAMLSMYKLPKSIDSRSAVVVSDALPTALECGVMNSNVQPGSSVVVIGAGPVGISCVLCAKLYSPSLLVVVDLDESRLETAQKMGAHATVNSDDPDARKILNQLTSGEGFDAVIEAVGIPATFEMGQELVAVGGTIANVGVHGTKVDLHLERLWDRNISINMQLVNATTLPKLLRLVESGMLDVSNLVTHCFPFSRATLAYDTFRTAAQTKALKVAISFNPEDEEPKGRL